MHLSIGTILGDDLIADYCNAKICIKEHGKLSFIQSAFDERN